MQCINWGIAGLRVCLRLTDAVPLLFKEFQVAVNILFKLANGLGRKRVRNRLAFASVFLAISCIEEPSLDGDESIIVFAASML